MDFDGELVNASSEQFEQLIDMKNEYITNPNTSLTSEYILSFARDSIGLENCYSWDDLRYYIDKYNG